RGIYESITDAKTYNADNLLGQDLQVIASEVYNFEKYYLLADADGKEIGWMYAGDVVTSALDAEPEEDNDTPEPETPEPETPEPETPEPETPEPETPEPETPEPETPEQQTPEQETPEQETQGTETP